MLTLKRATADVSCWGSSAPRRELDAAHPEIIINEPAVGYRLNVGGSD
jgi:hypothetical protein